MKTTLFLIGLVVVIASCNQTDSKTAATKPVNLDSAYNDSTNYTNIQWLDSIHQQLGKINEGQTPEITWKFKNTGDKPLVIINAQGTCGCTIAEKPMEPIAPGEEGEIKAKFNSEGRVGPNKKQVIVTANTKGGTSHYLGFDVEVIKK